MINAFINHGSHWQWLHRCFKPAALKLFVTWFATVPIFYKFFEKLPKQVTLYDFGSVTIVLGLPFSWQILWLGSLLYFVGAVLYQVFCPGFIKRFPDYSAFCDQRHSPRFLVWEFCRTWKVGEWDDPLWEKAKIKGLVAEVTAENEKNEACEALGGKESAGPIVRADVTVFYIKRQTQDKNGQKTVQLFKACLGDEKGEDADRKHREVFWEIFGAHANESAFVRYLIWFLLALAYLCVIYVILEKIVFTLRVMI